MNEDNWLGGSENMWDHRMVQALVLAKLLILHMRDIKLRTLQELAQGLSVAELEDNLVLYFHN